MSTEIRKLMPDVPSNLPPGERQMIASVRAVPGHEEPLAAALGALAAAVRQEPGCREFRPFRDVADPAHFYLYEIYDDTEAFKAHLATDHVAHFFTEVAQHSTSDGGDLIQLAEIPVP